MNQIFDKTGFLISRNFLDNSCISLLQTYFALKYEIIKYKKETNAEEAPKKTNIIGGDVASSYSFYADTLTEAILINKGQDVSNILNVNIAPTYSYARIYEKGDVLIPHTDRVSCEISATIPVQVSDNKPSTIYIANYDSFDAPRLTLDEIKKQGDYSEVILQPGDALFYKGHTRYHWREPLESDWLFQFFIHYVNKDGPYSNASYDFRPMLGLDLTSRN